MNELIPNLTTFMLMSCLNPVLISYTKDWAVGEGEVVSESLKIY